MTGPEEASAPADPDPPSNYLDLYGLSKPPFGGIPDNAGYILFGSHRRAFELLVDHMMNGSGVLLLIGEPGIGKTETLRSAAAVAAESGLQTIMVSRPPDGRITLDQLASSMGGHPEAFHLPPRKALLIDDFELMPNDGVSLLLFLGRAKVEEPDGSAIVLSTSATNLSRPDITELASLARNTIRLARLGPAEIRQYIERSLWVAGGTTRRLITPEAIKLIAARSNGAPGTVNRVMEAALTAGFARGDVMITAKTVDSVSRPPPPRLSPRPVWPELSTRTERALQIGAAGLLVTGISVFLYKGLSAPSEHPLPPPSKPVSIAQTPEEPSSPSAKSADTLSPELMAALMKRGNESLELGDIASARLLFQRAAEGGNAAAATALGKTYDPNLSTGADTSDAVSAAVWYRKATELGDPNAYDLLKRLAGR